MFSHSACLSMYKLCLTFMSFHSLWEDILQIIWKLYNGISQDVVIGLLLMLIHGCWIDLAAVFLCFNPIAACHFCYPHHGTLTWSNGLMFFLDTNASTMLLFYLKYERKNTLMYNISRRDLGFKFIWRVYLIGHVVEYLYLLKLLVKKLNIFVHKYVFYWNDSSKVPIKFVLAVKSLILASLGINQLSWLRWLVTCASHDAGS
jgi:hypothetical protein